MNESGDEARIPLSLDVDASSVAQAQAAAEKFEGTIAQLRQQLESLRQQFTKTFNQQTAGLGGQMQAASYAAFKQAPPGQAGLNQAIIGATPQLQQLQARIAQLEQQEATGAVTGAKASPAKAEAAEHKAAARDRQDRAADDQETRTRRRRSSASGEETPRQSFSERLMENITRTRPLAATGALAMGNVAPLGRSLATSFLQAVASTPLPAGSPSGGGLMSSLVGGVGARALATGGVAGEAAGATVGAGEAAAGAVSAGASASTIGSVLSGALSTPVGALLAAATGLLGAGLYRQKLQALSRTEQVQFGSSVGGLNDGPLQNQYSRALDIGHAYMATPQEALTTAGQLGQAGVTGPALLGQGQQPGALATTLAFAKSTGVPQAQAAQLTASLMVQGKQSVEQVAQVFQVLQRQARDTSIPVDRLVGSLTSLEQAAGGTGLTVRGTAGLAAAQSILGPGVNAGSLLGPAMGSIGSQSTGLAAVLGMSPDQFYQAQQNPATMLDTISQFSQRFAAGRHDQGTKNNLASILQQTGMLNLSGLSPKTANQVLSDLMAQRPGGTQSVADRILKDTGLTSAALYASQGASLAQSTAGPDTAAALNLEYAKRALGGVPSTGGAVPRPFAEPPPTAPGKPRATDFLFQRYRVPAGTYNQYLAASQKYHVPLALLLAQGATESSFNQFAVNDSTNARGLAQITPALQADLQAGKGIYSDSPFKGHTMQPFNTGQATQAAGYLMGKYLAREGGNQTRALQDYIQGPYAQGAPSPDATKYAADVQQVEVQLSGTLTVRDSHGGTVGTVAIAPKRVTINPQRPPVGHQKQGPVPRIPVPPAHGGGQPARQT